MAVSFSRAGLLIFLLALILIPSALYAQSYRDLPFGNQQRVSIVGYEGHAMEPFLSRDGNILFFNNRNEPTEQTDIHMARRVDDLTFTYVGPLDGAAMAGTLDGVPSLDRDGNFYFVSLRSYGDGFSTIYHGSFDGTRIVDVRLLDGVSRDEAFWVNFDSEITGDGNTLYFVDGLFRPIIGGWRRANLSIAVRGNNGEFRRDPNAARILANINTNAWEYAAGISGDELELFFTRYNGFPPFGHFSTWHALRNAPDEPFGEPVRIRALDGYAEAASPSPDGRAIYFHRRVDGIFSIFRVTR